MPRGMRRGRPLPLAAYEESLVSDAFLYLSRMPLFESAFHQRILLAIIVTLTSVLFLQRQTWLSLCAGSFAFLICFGYLYAKLGGTHKCFPVLASKPLQLGNLSERLADVPHLHLFVSVTLLAELAKYVDGIIIVLLAALLAVVLITWRLQKTKV